MWILKFIVFCIRQMAQLFQHISETSIVSSVSSWICRKLAKSTLLSETLTHFKVMGVTLPVQLPLMSMRITDNSPAILGKHLHCCLGLLLTLCTNKMQLLKRQLLLYCRVCIFIDAKQRWHTRMRDSFDLSERQYYSFSQLCPHLKYAE